MSKARPCASRGRPGIARSPGWMAGVALKASERGAATASDGVGARRGETGSPSPVALPTSLPQTAQVVACAGSSVPHPRQNTLCSLPLHIRPTETDGRFLSPGPSPRKERGATSHLRFVLVFLLRRVDFGRLAQRLLGLVVAAGALERLGQRLVADGEGGVERDRRLGHLDGIVYASDLQIGIREVVTDAGVERVAFQRALVRRDSLVVAAEGVQGGGTLVERLGIVG